MSGLGMGARYAALIVAYGGRVTREQLRQFTRECGVTGRTVRSRDGKSNGSKVGMVVRRRMNQLVDEELVVHVGDDYEAVDIAELAAWVADELDDDSPPARMAEPAGQWHHSPAGRDQT
jgi:hypothetical protein